MKKKGMIFAAGLGTRFIPWTKSHPKALAMINGKSLLQRNIEYFMQYGIEDIVINVHHFSEQIIEALEKNNNWGAKITISDESDELLETGGGLKKAERLLDADHIFIINADILTDVNLDDFFQHHLKTEALATLAVSDRSSSRYFLFNDKNQLVGWENIKIDYQRWAIRSTRYQRKAFSGLHIIKGELIPKIKQNGKFSIVDVYLDLAQTENIQYYDHTGAKFIDVGKQESIEIANNLFL